MGIWAGKRMKSRSLWGEREGGKKERWKNHYLLDGGDCGAWNWKHIRARVGRMLGGSAGEPSIFHSRDGIRSYE